MGLNGSRHPLLNLTTILVLGFGLASGLSAAGSPAAGSPAAGAEDGTDDGSLTWSHSTRDVYWNGELNPQVEVLSAEGSRWAVALPEAQGVYVLQPDADDEPTVAKVPTETFAWSEDRLEATSSMIEPKRDAELFDFPDGIWIRDTSAESGRHLVVAPHQGPSGALSVDELWATVPVWHSAYEAYEPTPEAVGAFRDEKRDLKLKVFFGTWCGDSRRSVPRLLSTLDAADNSKLSVELVAIGRGFTEPMGEIRRFRVTNVPTVVVFEGNHEVGRFVERPHSDNVETDLAAVLAGRPIPPKALFHEDDQLLASGRYGLFAGRDGSDPAERIGEESWRLFKIADGGYRLHTQHLEGGRRTDTWHRRTEQGPTAFVEITRSIAGELSRTRTSFGEQVASATTRGSEGGILKQTTGLIDDRGDRALVSAPSVAGWGFLWSAAARPKNRVDKSALVWPGAGQPTAGRAEALTLDWLGADTWSGTESATEHPCDRVAVSLGKRTGELCLHPELDVPVRASWGDGEARLESLDVVGAGPAAEVESP